MSTVSGIRRAILELLTQYDELTPAEVRRLEPDMRRSTAYITMARLEEDKWLTSRHELVVDKRTRPLRYYSITPLGQQALELAQAQDSADVQPVLAAGNLPNRKR